jgi:hypothetical protein
MESVRYGPGVWFSIHILALKAVDNSSKKMFIEFIDILSDTFPCIKCRKHIKNYVSEHPIQKFWNEENGFFKWSWIFHNVVNLRLNKPIMEYSEALEKYTILHDTCTKGCDTDSSVYLSYDESERQIPRAHYISVLKNRML